MTPKEKAQELIEKFNDLDTCKNHFSNQYDGNICKHLARKCALIAVDEIINEPAYADSGSTYWQQVKQQISNL